MSEQTAEIFAIGEELLRGRIYDTNSFWLAEQASLYGLRVNRITCLPDEIETIQEAVGAAIVRLTTIVFITGGLGPTDDDRTVEAIAGLLDTDVVTADDILADYCRRRNIAAEELTPNLLRMARIPAGAMAFPNPAGWAPGIMVETGATRIFLFPGPPKEVQGVFNHHIAPLLAVAEARGHAIRVWVNMYESEVAPLLVEIMNRYPGVYAKAYVSLWDDDKAALPVDLTVSAESATQANDLITDAVAAFDTLVSARGKTMQVTITG